MPHVIIGSALTRHLESKPPVRGELSYEVTGSTLRESLEAVFDQQPQLRGYVVDELGAIRHHVVLFLDGQVVTDRRELKTPLTATSELYVLQALSGG